MTTLANPKKSKLWLVLGLILICAALQFLEYLARWPWAYAMLALPGTTLHEGAHAVVSWMLDGQPQGFSLWPKDMGDGRYMLGSVWSVMNWWNTASISLAPLGLGAFAAIGLFSCVMFKRWIWRLAGAYVAACAVSSLWPSSIDWNHALQAPMSWPLAILLGAIWYFVAWKILRILYIKHHADSIGNPKILDLS